MNKTTPATIGQDATPLFFPVSRRKLIVLSLCSLGIYEVYWFYKNWVLIKQRTREDISPFWRAVFGVIFCYSLLQRVGESAQSHGVAETINPSLLTVAFIGLTVSWRLPDPFWLISLFSFLPLLQAQKVIEEINLRAAPHAERNDRFSGKNIAVIILGGLVLILAVIGTFVQG